MSNIAQTIDSVTPSTLAVLSQTVTSDCIGPLASTHRSNGASPNNAADNAARMAELFAGSDRGHGTYGEPMQHPGSSKWEIKNSARTSPVPATPDHWCRHLKGERPLGVIPIRSDGKCKWGSIDIDEYDGNFLELINKAHRAKLPLIACRSKSGGLHFFLFLEEWTAASTVRSILTTMKMRLGLSKNSEIFPKQTELGNDKLGNWIAMPYGSDFGGKLKEQVGINATGGEMSLGLFLNMAEESRLSAAKVQDMTSPLKGRNEERRNDRALPQLPEIAAALDAIAKDSSYTDNYQEWIEIGMAVHHGTGGSDEGCDLFEKFSKRFPKYKYGEPSAKWESFGPGGNHSWHVIS
jgi:Primase C terminal 2 (PriCT-2)